MDGDLDRCSMEVGAHVHRRRPTGTPNDPQQSTVLPGMTICSRLIGWQLTVSRLSSVMIGSLPAFGIEIFYEYQPRPPTQALITALVTRAGHQPPVYTLS